MRLRSEIHVSIGDAKEISSLLQTPIIGQYSFAEILISLYRHLNNGFLGFFAVSVVEIRLIAEGGILTTEKLKAALQPCKQVFFNHPII